MLTQVNVEADSVLALPVSGAQPRDSLHLESITGLGPPDKTLFVGDYARDGGLYTGRKVDTRNPVLTIELNPNYANGETMSGLRRLLYKTFNDPLPTSDAVTLVLLDDEEDPRYLTGYCDKFTNEVFGSDNTVQVSLICPDPYIYDLAPVDLMGAWTVFPNLTYAGDAEAGLKVVMKVTSSTTIVTLDLDGQTMVLTADASAPFQVGDILTINTITGSRSITLTRAGTSYDVLFMLSASSPWLYLHSLSNTLRSYGTSSTNDVATIQEISYTPTWWGI